MPIATRPGPKPGLAATKSFPALASPPPLRAQRIYSTDLSAGHRPHRWKKWRSGRRGRRGCAGIAGSRFCKSPRPLGLGRGAAPRACAGLLACGGAASAGGASAARRALGENQESHRVAGARRRWRSRPREASAERAPRRRPARCRFGGGVFDCRGGVGPNRFTGPVRPRRLAVGRSGLGDPAGLGLAIYRSRAAEARQRVIVASGRGASPRRRAASAAGGAGFGFSLSFTACAVRSGRLRRLLGPRERDAALVDTSADRARWPRRDSRPPTCSRGSGRNQ
jgi:hypothetical protein